MTNSETAATPRRRPKWSAYACALLIPPSGSAPLESGEPADTESSAVYAPLDSSPAEAEPGPPDPRRVRIVRWDALVGPTWRIRTADTLVSTSVEIGQQHGFSGAFHTGFIIASDRDDVQAFDVPIGLGVIARGKVPGRDVFGSVGLSAGILVHRANTERGVVHRVDPDFRVPLRFAWTARKIGLSIALLPGYSVRNRVYERRGTVQWSRSAFRIGFALGIHVDAAPRRLQGRRQSRQSRRTR